MKFIWLLPCLILPSCVESSIRTNDGELYSHPRASEPSANTSIPHDVIYAAFLSAPAFATEVGQDDLGYWMKRHYVASEVRGDWLGSGGQTLLVTLDLKETDHAGGLVHHLLAVFDPVTHERLTPVFHYCADHLTKRETHTFAGKYSVLYLGYVQQGPYVRHISGQLRFDSGQLSWKPVEINEREGKVEP
jgi:hypothetical protein